MDEDYVSSPPMESRSPVPNSVNLPLSRNGVHILQCGGTIDKDYPRKACGYAFEICEPAAKRILAKAFLTYSDGLEKPGASLPLLTPGSAPSQFIVEEVLKEDSLDMTDAHRERIANRIIDICKNRMGVDAKGDFANCGARILITHGTDTMIVTGQYILDRLARIAQRPWSLPVIVLTGALLPERFKDSDADFNLGLAIGALQCLTEAGVYIAFSGQVIPVQHAGRIIATGKFFNTSES